MEFEKRPSKPVVKSLSSADQEFKRWLFENHFQFVLDQEGVPWQVSIELQQLPAEGDLKSSSFKITLSLDCEMNGEALVKSGALESQEVSQDDARLLRLLGSDKVAMKMRPTTYEVESEQAAKTLLTQILPRLRDDMARTKLNELKRALAGRHIDQSAVFGQNRHNMQMVNTLRDVE